MEDQRVPDAPTIIPPLARRNYELAVAVTALESGSLSSKVFSALDSAYGAKGNGTTDDTGALQAAANAAKAVGGTLYLPAGDYLCSGGLSIMGSGFTGQKLTIRGDGLNSRILSPIGADLAALVTVGGTGPYPGTNTFVTDVMIRDLALVFNGSHTTGHGLIVRGHRCTVQNVGVYNAPQDGIRWEGTDIWGLGFGLQFFLADHALVYNHGRDGIYVDGTDLWVQNCNIASTSTIATPRGRHGIYSRGFGAEFVNNWAFSNGSDGFYADTGNDVHIRGGQYADNNFGGIVIQNANRVVVEACMSFDCPGNAFKFVTVNDLMLHHCHSGRVDLTYAKPTDAILLNGVTNASVHDNVLNGWTGSMFSILTGTSHVNIHDNVGLEGGASLLMWNQGTYINVHDNQANLGITESSPGDHNLYHDNQMNGAAITGLGVNSVSRNNW